MLEFLTSSEHSFPIHIREVNFHQLKDNLHEKRTCLVTNHLMTQFEYQIVLRGIVFSNDINSVLDHHQMLSNPFHQMPMLQSICPVMVVPMTHPCMVQYDAPLSHCAHPKLLLYHPHYH